MTILRNRYDFVLIFDVANGNPNGDPDAGNLPRLDPETNHGLVSDVSLKRRVRNYVELAKGGAAGFHIYVQEGAILNEKHREAYAAVRPKDSKVSKEKSLNPRDEDEANQLRSFMCRNFFDVRAFGAVMSTGINCGQVRGPVQVTFAHSIEPIMPQEISITRVAATSKPAKVEGQTAGHGNTRTDNRTMGRKYIVPYGLYRAHGFVSAKLAERTGFDETDLELLFDAVAGMFEHDRSAARGEMASRKLIVFKHANALGNAAAHALFERVRIGRNINGTFCEVDGSGSERFPPARKFADYAIRIDSSGLPKGVEMIERL